MNFRYRLIRFMTGRYGPDTLGKIMIGIAAVLALLNCFLRILWLQIPIYLLMAVVLFRMFSRNIPARAKENRFFRDFFVKTKKKRDVYYARKADRNHIYKKCPTCGVVLRLPRRKGKHTTVCPHCSHSFGVRVWR